MRRVILIDALNMFIRSWTINPSMSTNGNPIGGTVGFLGSIRKVVNDFSPDEVVICWDGAGGSQKRRQVIKSYKEAVFITLDDGVECLLSKDEVKEITNEG